MLLRQYPSRTRIDRDFNDRLLSRDLYVEAINQTASFRLELAASDRGRTDIHSLERRTLRSGLRNFGERWQLGISSTRLNGARQLGGAGVSTLKRSRRQYGVAYKSLVR